MWIAWTISDKGLLSAPERGIQRALSRSVSPRVWRPTPPTTARTWRESPASQSRRRTARDPPSTSPATSPWRGAVRGAEARGRAGRGTSRLRERAWRKRGRAGGGPRDRTRRERRRKPAIALRCNVRSRRPPIAGDRRFVASYHPTAPPDKSDLALALAPAPASPRCAATAIDHSPHSLSLSTLHERWRVDVGDQNRRCEIDGVAVLSCPALCSLCSLCSLSLSLSLSLLPRCLLPAPLVLAPSLHHAPS